MQENLNIFDFELDQNEMDSIDKLNCNYVMLDSQGIDDPNYIYNM